MPEKGGRADGVSEDDLMYTVNMRRIQIYIDETLDERLQAEAARTGRSKAALIRESVAARYEESAGLEEDPLTRLIGSVDAEPAEVDEIVYGPDQRSAPDGP